MSNESRLARAMDVFLDCQERGIERDQACLDHPDLAELLCLLWAGEIAADDADAQSAYGQYRIVREVGRGGMGVVYEASQSSLGRRVALKVLGASPTPTQIVRFRREAMTLARLDHAHVVRVLDVGETGGRHWLAMELVDGRSLAARLDELRALGGHRGPSLRQLVESIAEVAQALEHVHAAGILHRDVKPSNVLLRSDGRALLSDFGLAHDAASPSMTQLGTLLGTPNYMSPEQVVGARTMTPASDVFSLGATLYECITLRRPFDGTTNDSALRQILTHDPVDPRRLHPGLPVDLAAIVLKAIEKDPERRYPTAAAFAADLRAFLELKPVHARPPSPLHRLRRWARREPWRAALAASLVACTALGVYVVAQLPDVRAAAAAREEREFEETLAAGWLQRSNNRRDAALATFRRAVGMRPHSSEAIAGLFLTLRHFDGVEAALAELDRERGPIDDPTLLQRARLIALQAAGRPDELAAIARDLPPPRTAADLWFSGTAKLVASKRGSADARVGLEQISLAVRMSPLPRLTLVAQWTMAAWHAQDQDALRECWQTLLRLWPDNSYAQHFAAIALAKSDPARALELVRQARGRGIDARESHRFELQLLNDLGRTDEVLAAAKAALEHPWDDGLRSVLIDQLVQHGDLEGATAAAEAWIAESPDNTLAMRRVAVVRSHAEDHAAAIELFTKVVARVPDDADARYDLAVAQHLALHDDDARATLRKVIELAPEHPRAHERLLAQLEADGDEGVVLAELRRWAGVRRGDASAHVELARALAKAAPPQLEEAMRALTTADYLAAGKDAPILMLRAELHDALGEHGAAQRCRDLARSLSPEAASGR